MISGEMIVGSFHVRRPSFGYKVKGNMMAGIDSEGGEMEL